MTQFSGFPQDGFDFLRELANNNERDWFEANKARYEESLLEPAKAFVTAVGEALEELSPNIHYDTRTNGSGSLMRIYRDTRFSKDKTPYKTNISGMWWEGPGKKTQSPAYGFQMTANGMGLMGGMFSFNKEQMASFREAVADETYGPALKLAISGLLAEGGYEILGEQYKKVPRGYDEDHPRADLLKYKGLYAHPLEGLTPEELMHPSSIRLCVQKLTPIAPLVDWQTEHLIS